MFSGWRLNRTFYGIETKKTTTQQHNKRVLIVPFMELKLSQKVSRDASPAVLIVPFMELKHNN